MRPAIAIAGFLLLALHGPLAAQTPPGDAAERFRQYLANRFASQRETAPEAGYQAAFRDLDGDGRPEVVAYMRGPVWCGPHGCDLLIFAPEGESWRLAQEISFGRTPIRLLGRSSSGWRDISVYFSTSLMPGTQMPLSFDGLTYRPSTRRLPRADDGQLLIGPDSAATRLFPEPEPQE